MAVDPTYIDNRRRGIGAYIKKLLAKEPRANTALISRLSGIGYDVICLGDDERSSGLLIGAIRHVGEDGYAITINLKRKRGPIILTRRKGVVVEERPSQSYIRLAERYGLPVEPDKTEIRSAVDLRDDPDPDNYPEGLMQKLDRELDSLHEVVKEVGKIKKVPAPTEQEIRELYG